MPDGQQMLDVASDGDAKAPRRRARLSLGARLFLTLLGFSFVMGIVATAALAAPVLLALLARRLVVLAATPARQQRQE
jgi:hypothetical protein